jgi:hypothetical protein
METRFAYELIVGILSLIAIILFGEKGMAVMALIAAQPFISKRKFDERESQILNKAGNYTAGATLLICILIYDIPDLTVNGQLVGKVWLIWVVAIYVIAHGMSGLIILRRN